MPVERKNGEIRVSAPLIDEDIAQLRAGEHVRFYGAVYTARDAAHRRMLQAVEKGEALPVDIKGQIIYYVGPTPPRPGRVIGSAGPTTAMRMDPFTPRLLELGMKMAIGKGGRGPRVQRALQDNRAAYCLAIGGAGALLSKSIRSVEVVAYEDLGTESMKRLEVEGFPAIVCCDMYGGDLLMLGKERWRQQEKLGAYQSVPPRNEDRDGGGS
jgi:fumarate hydratase subunit beta